MHTSAIEAIQAFGHSECGEVRRFDRYLPSKSISENVQWCRHEVWPIALRQANRAGYFKNGLCERGYK